MTPLRQDLLFFYFVSNQFCTQMTENSKDYSLKILIYEFVRNCELGHSRKNPNKGGWAEDIEFQGVLKKEHMEIPEVS